MRNKAITFMQDARRPDFADPPVVEVVLSVQFEPLSRLGVSQLGALWWSTFRTEFPRTEDKGPLPTVFESFDAPKQQPLSVEVISEPPPPRCWYVNGSGTELVQVQRDRFVFNWRGGSFGEPYPRYEEVLSKFKKYFSQFEKYAEGNEIGAIVPNQCEVTYVNHILPSKGWNRLGQFEKIFSFWSGRYSDQFLNEPEDIQFRIRYRIPNDKGVPIGRLHVSAEPRIKREDGSKLVRLTLTARGAPHERDQSGVEVFFNLAREQIVRGFASITAEQMHRTWGRNDA